MLLTSRPQVESSFTAWKPERIKATDKENMDDMRLVLQGRLEQLQFVEGSVLSAAVQLMLERSDFQFVYLKFAFEALQAAWDRRQQQQGRWSLSQLEQSLPPGRGVECTYLHSLIQLRDALAAERPELLELLTKRVLPVLAVCRELLTVQELAWAVAAPEVGVDLLVRLLGNIFPIRHGVITPYHKTVLDWLLPVRGGKDHPFKVDVQAGHALLARACKETLAEKFPFRLPKEATQNDEAQEAVTTGERYALRHAVAHACRPGGSPQLLRDLLLDFGAWEAILRAGKAAFRGDGRVRAACTCHLWNARAQATARQCCAI